MTRCLSDVSTAKFRLQTKIYEISLPPEPAVVGDKILAVSCPFKEAAIMLRL